jgi:hypothetical protein
MKFDLKKSLLEGILATSLIVGVPSLYSAEQNKQKTNCYLAEDVKVKDSCYNKSQVLSLMEKLKQKGYDVSLVEYKDENEKPVYFPAIKTSKKLDDIEIEIINKFNKHVGVFKKENADYNYIECKKKKKEFEKKQAYEKQDLKNREEVINTFYEFVNAIIQEDPEKASSYIHCDGNFMDFRYDIKNKAYSDKNMLIDYFKQEFEKEDLKKLKLEEVIKKDLTLVDGYEERGQVWKLGKHMKKGDYALKVVFTDKWPGENKDFVWLTIFRKIDGKWKMATGNYVFHP